MHSRIHALWALAQGTQLREKESGFRYTPTTCFETFPFPFPDDLATTQRHVTSAPPDDCRSRRKEASDESPAAALPPPDASSRPRLQDDSASLRQRLQADIAAAAKELNDLRERWLNPPEWTVTRYLEFPGTVGGPWHRYLANAEGRMKKGEVGLVRYPRLEPRDAECAAKLKQRTLTNLYNERPAWLDLAHKKLDAAVAAAYGWVRDGQPETDLTDEQILERLLALNLARAAEEAKAAKVKKPKAQRERSAGELL
jgi:hypothetical protein